MTFEPASQPLDLLAATESVCPRCLARIPAIREQQGDAVFLVKHCPEHGTFRTRIWRGSTAFAQWLRPKVPAVPKHAFTAVEAGCPFDCGLCPEHGQHTCTALIEVTRRCNLGCRVCFADAGQHRSAPDLSLGEIEFLFDRILEASGPCNIQLSGGEPTVHRELASIISLGRTKGFGFIQLNTNGLRLGQESGLAAELKAAGLSSVFLQFDGLTDAVHRALRGRNLAAIKEQAVARSAEAGLAVVLVPTLVPGINTDQVGPILDFAARRSPAVRGVHFQPISYFGRFPQPPADDDRLTLAELLDLILDQSGGRLTPEHFAPPACEHSLCSFHGNFLVNEDASLSPLSTRPACCSTGEPRLTALEGRERSVAFTARQWSPPTGHTGCDSTAAKDDFDRFLARARSHTLCISAMAFQDAWNLDLERLRGCCIHVAAPDGRLIPFCAYNLTSAEGKPLYRNLNELCP